MVFHATSWAVLTPYMLFRTQQLSSAVTRWKRLQLSTMPGCTGSGVSIPVGGLVLVDVTGGGEVVVVLVDVI